ncbi:MAG: twin-arginine translocation signal domain-containing protein, partial [Gemmatimonadetes bacterium]|nr:twin-arginine translocation signal domain-containing protein [Gemmatimonadota bacterium]
MTTRREFLRRAALASAATVALPACTDPFPGRREAQ